MTTPAYAEHIDWTPEVPRFRPLRLLLSWFLSALALLVAAWIVPHVDIPSFWGAVGVAAVVAIVNAVLPPILAALRLPFTLVIGFLGVLVIDAFALLFASDLDDRAIQVDSFWWALLTALIAAAVSVVLEVIFGTNDDDTYSLKVTRRIARRQGGVERTDVPGDHLPRDRRPRAARAAAGDARRQRPEHGALAGRGHALAHRVGDRSLLADRRQPGRHPARLERGHPRLPLGREGDGHGDDCSAPADCAEIERRHATGIGLLTNGGASRGNLLSGEAEHVILTVSRIEAEKGPIPATARSSPTATTSPALWSCSPGR